MIPIGAKLADDRIATNLRMLLIMETLGQTNSACSPTEIAKAMGLPKQTVHRLCATLVREGFLVGESPGKKLRPARRSREMAAGIMQNSRHHIARHQILLDLAREVGETVNYVMPEQDGMSYKDRVETDWPFRVQLPIGSSVPFHCTASGKCFLASLPKRDREKLVEALPMEKLTDNTLADREALLAELKNISRQGFAIDNEEFMDGMVAIAVPVPDQKGRFVAAIAFHGPTMRLTIDAAIEKKQVLFTAAARLSKIIFDADG